MNIDETPYKGLHSRKYLKDIRKKLRNNGTKAEALMWTYLKKRQLGGFKFRRQHSIGNFILDFYCHEKCLGIELDGNPHFTVIGLLMDSNRDEWLAKNGVKVLHFENEMVFKSIEIVLDEILSELNK